MIGCGILNPDRVLEIYLISFKGGRIRLFAPSDDLEFFENQSEDRMRRFIAWLTGQPVRASSPGLAGCFIPAAGTT